MKIYNSGIINIQNIDKKSEQNPEPNGNLQAVDYTVGLSSKFNDHLVTFKGRVDKGLDRFFEANKDVMPYTVRLYVQSLEDKSRLTPLEAQRRAFNKLETANTLDDIKRDFPDENLFKELINPEESKARRGIIKCIKENKELLELSGEGVLKNKENFTIYLLKKVFLEAKTIDEINKDLENDLNEDFKTDFKYKNPDSKYIYGSTLKSIGLQVPNFEYQQSLRYTRDGYSDMMGDKISESLEAYFDSLTDSERLERAKKRVKKFENWWNSFTQNEKLEMLADKENILNMLKEYKKAERAENKKQKQTAEENGEQTPEKAPRKKVKVGSEILSQDELFKRWATANLKIFEASLAEFEKDSLHLKRMRNAVARWKEMSSEERTDYISKMKSGREPLRYAMIDAWNHCKDIIQELSVHLKENQIFKPADLLYSTEEFSQFQSQVMTQFWESHPEFAVELGDAIRESQLKVELAIKNGTFEVLKRQINRDKNDRIKDLAKFKAQQGVQFKPQQSEENNEPEYKKEFRKAYESHIYGRIKSVPKNYYHDMYDTVLDILPEDVVVSWTRNLRGETLTPEERKKIEEILFTEPGNVARINRALEAAMADTLYEFTGNADVYRLSSSDVKTAMYHLERGEYPIEFESHKLGLRFILEPLPSKINKKVDPNRINLLYEKYKQDLTDFELEEIVNCYFKNNYKSNLMKKMSNDLSMFLDSEAVKDYAVEYKQKFDTTKEMLKEYIATYGKSALILFSEKSVFPNSVKNALNTKFFAHMPSELKEQDFIIPLIKDKQDIDKEKSINKACYLYGQRFSFVPQEFMSAFSKEVARQLRQDFNEEKVSSFIERVCAKRKDIKSKGTLAVFPRSEFTIENKLKTLAMEQALADVLYEATDNISVYHMDFENLSDNIELFSLARKFPTEERNYSDDNGKTFVNISAKRKLNMYKIQKLYRQYVDDISQLLKEFSDGKYTEKEFYEELFYILNPETNNYQKDMEVMKRFAKYGFPVETIKVYPNGQE